MARKTFTTETLASADLNAALDWAAYEAHPSKANVRVASTASITLATSAESGDAIDGVTLATGDRILLKNQANAYENGIYVVASSGEPTRSTDADTDDKVNSGVECYIEEGTTNAGKKFKLATTGVIILNTTNLSFTEMGGSGGSVPTGTGIPHVVSGVQQAAASLIVNADVASDAAIAESKLALASDAAVGTPSRRTIGTGALQAAAGNHGHSNATTSVAGFMSGTDKTKLDAAIASPTASTLMLRDASGRAQIAAPAADSDVATKKYVDDATTAGAPDASESTKGITLLSVAPDTDPVAVGANDPRVQPFEASGDDHTSGLVPDPGATPGSAKFLREDATWATPPAGTLAVQQDGEAAVNSIDTIIVDGGTVTGNEDGSVTLSDFDANTLEGEDGVHYLSRANHTGSQAISTVTGLQTELDDLAAASLPAGGTEGQVLAITSGAPGWADPTGGGGGGITPEPVEQAGHGLSVGNLIQVTGNDTYDKAQADSVINAEIAGIVTTVGDTDNFEYLPVGPIITGSGWTAGEVQFLDPVTAGATTATPPSTEGQIVKPVLLPINATQAILLDYVGYAVPSEGGGSDSTTIVGVSVRVSSDVTLTNSVSQKIAWDEEYFDTHSFHNPSSNPSRLTVPTGQAGLYHVTAQALIDSGATGEYTLNVLTNDGFPTGAPAPVLEMKADAMGSNDGSLSASAYLNLSVGDYVEMRLGQSSGSDLDAYSGYTFLQMVKIGSLPS